MSLLIDLFINNLLPIFLIAGVGIILAKWRKVGARSLSQVIFYFFTPCLIFDLIVHSKVSGAEMITMSLVAIPGMAFAGIFAWVAGRFLHFERSLITAVILAAMLPNAGNYGLATVKFAFGDEALTQAGLFFTISSIYFYTCGVLVASMGSTKIHLAFFDLLKIPAVYAVVLGIVFAQLNFHLPIFLDRATSLAGSATVPAMLVLLGIQLASNEMVKNGLSIKMEIPGYYLSQNNKHSHWFALGLVCLLRLVGAPLFSYGSALLIGMKGAALQASIVESATPTAVMSIVLATEYKATPSLVANAVLITTLLSPFTMTPLLAWLGGR